MCINMDEYIFTAQIREDGRGSKKIAVTKACKALELDAGDYIEVRLKKVDRCLR